MTPDPTSYVAVGAIALTVFSIAAGLNQVLKVIDRMRGEPPAEELKGSLDSVVTRLNALDRMVAEMRVELHEGQEARSRDNDDRRRAIYEKIEGVRLELKRDIGELHEKIGDMPNELIVLLKNTGAIRTGR